MFWLKCNKLFAENPFCQSTAESKLFLSELLCDFRRAGVQHMRSIDVYYCTFLWCSSSLSLTALVHIIEKHSPDIMYTQLRSSQERLTNHDRVFICGWTIAFLLERVSQTASVGLHVYEQSRQRLCTRRWRYLPFQHLVRSTNPNLRGTGGFSVDKTQFHASNTREEMKFKSETCELKPLV